MTSGPVRDAEATRKRLLAAASDEFARYGIAGARVDRIAAAAAANKAQIYHYFNSKEELFQAVYYAMVAQVVAQVPIDASDLPDYAGRLVDGYEDHPNVARLATWQRLELADRSGAVPAVVDSVTRDVAAIAAAQEAGQVSTRFTAAEILALVYQIAGIWTVHTPDTGTMLDPGDRARRRQVVVDAVEAITRPRHA